MDEMEMLQVKKKDDNYELWTVRDCRDADNGYCVYFEDPKEVKVPDPRPQFVNKGDVTVKVNPGEPGHNPDQKMKVEVTYWLPKSYNIIPKPAYIKDKVEVAADQFRIYGTLGMAGAGVYGIDIIREELEGKTTKRRVIALFYNPELVKKKEEAPAAPAAAPAPKKTKPASKKKKAVA